TGVFHGTPEEFDAALRASMITLFDPDDEPALPVAGAREDVIAVGPTPCDSCDPLDIDNPSSPNYDPSILAVFIENDVLAPPDGPGLPTCQGVTSFWAGANDQCWAGSAVSGSDPANVDQQIPRFTSLGQHYAICGQVGTVNTSGFTGDPNNPGAP